MALSLQLIVLLCVTTGLWIGAEACEPACPPGWSAYGSSCYIFHFDAMDWGDAEKFCTTIGGNLASVHSKEQYQHLMSTLLQLTGKNTNIWIGGYDAAKNGVWLWSDGSAFNFKLFSDGEPNGGRVENCMEMNFRERDYVNDSLCHLKKSFFCVKAQ